MVPDLEFMLMGRLFLPVLDLRVNEFIDLAALIADHMIMMTMPILVFEIGLLVRTPPLGGQAHLGQGQQIAVDGRFVYFRKTRSGLLIDIADRQMFFAVQEYLQDILSLCGTTQVVLLQVIVKYLLFDPHDQASLALSAR
jgi:hypothetical protein